MTISNSTMMCLRWDSLSSKLSLSDTFRELRTESDFFDVSLGCASGSKDNSLRAHRVILSAYSDVFKEMLRQHQNHNNPFIYLKDVSYGDLSAMLDFIYYGEVYVERGNLDSFLAVAKDLQVKGLTENVTSTDDIVHQQSSERNKFFQPDKEEQLASRLRKAKTLMRGQLDEINSKNKHGLKLTSTSSRHLLTNSSIDRLGALKKYQKRSLLRSPLNVTIPDPADGISLKREALTENGKDTRELLHATKQEEDTDSIADNSQQMKGTIKHLMCKIPSMHEEGKKPRAMAKCKLCSKEGRTDHIQKHIKTAHQQFLLDSDVETVPIKSQINPSRYIKVEEFVEDTERREMQGIKLRKFVTCKVCKKELRSDRVKAHFRRKHPELAPELSNEKYEPEEEHRVEEENI